VSPVFKQLFKRVHADSLIVLSCTVDYDPLALTVDTGASNTTIDITPMLIAGYEIHDAIRLEKIETASGIIDACIGPADKVNNPY
jgi:hypothetical protein